MTVPVQPDPDTARGWVQAELADPAYTERVDVMSLLLRWLQEKWEELLASADGRLGGGAALAVAAAVIVVLAVTWWVAGPLRARRRAARDTGDVFGARARTAAEHRAAAEAAAAAGDLDTAVVERFRAILRALDERAILDLVPGRTAHECALEAAGRFPDRTVELVTASALFDDVRFGDHAATAAEARALAELDAALAAARPVDAAPVPSTVPR